MTMQVLVDYRTIVVHQLTDNIISHTKLTAKTSTYYCLAKTVQFYTESIMGLAL